MALLLNEEQTMLRDSARSFLADNAPVAQLRQLRDSHDPAGFSGPTVVGASPSWALPACGAREPMAAPAWARWKSAC